MLSLKAAYFNFQYHCTWLWGIIFFAQGINKSLSQKKINFLNTQKLSLEWLQEWQSLFQTECYGIKNQNLLDFFHIENFSISATLVSFELFTSSLKVPDKIKLKFWQRALINFSFFQFHCIFDPFKALWMNVWNTNWIFDRLWTKKDWKISLSNQSCKKTMPMSGKNWF